jgi:Fe-Mn family superoxide dismutase
MNFQFKDLPYGYNELKSISPRALELHHGAHYKTYLENVNKLLEESKYENDSNLSLEKLITKHHSSLDSLISRKIFNNAAQVFNHEFYWDSMSPNGGGTVSKESKLFTHITKKFENFDNFIKKFKEISLNQFGSGWSWLVFNKKLGELEIISTSNALTPLTDENLELLLTIDVWEHAYYRDFENKRNFYLDKFFEHLINWKFAEKNFEIKN